MERSSVFGLTAENHAMRVPASERSRSQVDNNDAKLILHTFNWNIFLQSTGDCTNLAVADVNFLIVELFTVWILLDPDDLADTNIHLWQLIQISTSCPLLRWILLLLLTLLLLLLFRLLLAQQAFPLRHCYQSASSLLQLQTVFSPLLFLASITASICHLQPLHQRQLS